MMRIEGHWFHQEKILIILLRQMYSITRFHDLRKEIRRSESQMCSCFNHMVNWMLDHHGWLLTDNWSPQLEGWYRAIKVKTGPYDENQYGKIVMFIDGTCVMISRPSDVANAFYDLQRLFWSGYKNITTSISLQNVVLGMCTRLF